MRKRAYPTEESMNAQDLSTWINSLEGTVILKMERTVLRIQNVLSITILPVGEGLATAIAYIEVQEERSYE